MSIKVGTIEDSFESLQIMCNDKSNELIKFIELSNGEVIEVVFYTADIPELIGIATITKDESGNLTYSLDYSMTTL